MADITAENLAYFNRIASEYDQKNSEMIAQLQESLRAKRALIGIKEGDRLLDYACGTGSVSWALGPYVRECVGIDLSDGMVGAFKARAQTQGLSRTAYQGNLADPSEPNPPAFSDAKFFDFDVAGVGFGWHHFNDPGLATKRLAERLKPGGVLFIMDFVPHGIDPTLANGRGVTHHGFDEAQMRDMFAAAGLTKDFAYEILPEPFKFKIHGHEHDHSHSHSHSHEHPHEGNHGHSHGDPGPRNVFIARVTKL